MLDFFRSVAHTIPEEPSSPTSDDDSPDLQAGSAREMLQDRAGIIVLREDLDFYVIPPQKDTTQNEMMQIKRHAGKALLDESGVFSGLKTSDVAGTTEQHLVEMLTAGSVNSSLRTARSLTLYSGFSRSDTWGHRAGEPNKAVICSLALARLRTDGKADGENATTAGMVNKLLLFWRKPARRCWWTHLELDHVDGVEGKLKVWIRRVWTLEMSVIGLR